MKTRTFLIFGLVVALALTGLMGCDKANPLGPTSINEGSVSTPGNQPPTADFTADHFNGNAPLTVSFTDKSTDSDGSITAWSWDFGDGTTAPEQNPQHEFAAGTWNVSLTVTDNGGKTGNKTKAVTVSQPEDQPHAWADSTIHLVVRIDKANSQVDSVLVNSPNGTIDRAKVEYTKQRQDQTGEGANLLWYCARTSLWYSIRFGETQGIGPTPAWYGFPALPVDAHQKIYWVWDGRDDGSPNSMHLHGVGGYEGSTGSGALAKRGDGNRGRIVSSREMPAILKALQK